MSSSGSPGKFESLLGQCCPLRNWNLCWRPAKECTDNFSISLRSATEDNSQKRPTFFLNCDFVRGKPSMREKTKHLKIVLLR